MDVNTLFSRLDLLQESLVNVQNHMGVMKSASEAKFENVVAKVEHQLNLFAAAMENQIFEKPKSVVSTNSSSYRSINTEVKSVQVDSLKVKSLAATGHDSVNNNSMSAGVKSYSEAASGQWQKFQYRKKSQPLTGLMMMLQIMLL